MYKEVGSSRDIKPEEPEHKPKDPPVESRSFAELQAYIGKLDNVTVRKWYTYHDKRIHEQIDPNLPLEEKAHKAFELRNEYRTQARELPADPEARRELDRKHPFITNSGMLLPKFTNSIV